MLYKINQGSRNIIIKKSLQDFEITKSDGERKTKSKRDGNFVMNKRDLKKNMVRLLATELHKIMLVPLATCECWLIVVLLMAECDHSKNLLL